MILDPVDRADWLAERRERVQASEVAAILRMSRWGGPLDVWARKRPGAEEEDRDSEPMLWGRLLEPVVMARTGELLGRQIVPNGLRIHGHAEAPLGATPDGFVLGPVEAGRPPRDGYEGKTVTWTRRQEWPETNDALLDVGPGCGVVLPPDPYCQVQACMACTGLDVWFLAALIGGQELRLYRVHRDPEDVAAILDAVRVFWRHVESGVPPEPDPTDRDPGSALLRAYRLPSGHAVELPAESELHARAWCEAHATRRAAESAEAYHAACLQRALGPAPEGTVAGHLVRWTPVKGRTSLDLDGLRRDRPDIVKEYTKLGAPTRRFDVKEVGDGSDSDA